MKFLIVVPYRNRPQHLAAFIAHMHERYKEIEICIVEQADNKPFNRGKLLNIGFLENQNYSKYIFHDIDMLPIGVNYSKYKGVGIVQLAKSEIQKVDYLGGVTVFGKSVFVYVGGYHNDYFHRAEDNEMMFNIKRLGIRVVNKYSQFKMLQHERKGPEFDPALWAKAQQPRAIQNQLPVCKYDVVYNAKREHNIRHIIAAI